MKTLELDEKMQTKVSVNGLDDSVDYSTIQCNVSLKVICTSPYKEQERIKEKCEPYIAQLRENPRLFTLFQHLTHYHDILYTSGVELGPPSDHNDQVISALSIHMLNHIMKVSIPLFLPHRRATSTSPTPTPSAPRSGCSTSRPTSAFCRKKPSRRVCPSLRTPTWISPRRSRSPPFKTRASPVPPCFCCVPIATTRSSSCIDCSLCCLARSTSSAGPSSTRNSAPSPTTARAARPTGRPISPGTTTVGAAARPLLADCFRVGVSFRGSTLRLYTDFYNSDWIIASPLSLKQIETRQGWDYLSSIEVLVVYGGDMIAMQNVDHLRGVLSNTNSPLVKNRNTDFSRLRESYLCEMQKYCRQTVFVNTALHSQILALFHRACFNPIVDSFCFHSL